MVDCTNLISLRVLGLFLSVSETATFNHKECRITGRGKPSSSCRQPTGKRRLGNWSGESNMDARFFCFVSHAGRRECRWSGVGQGQNANNVSKGQAKNAESVESGNFRLKALKVGVFVSVNETFLEHTPHVGQLLGRGESQKEKGVGGSKQKEHRTRKKESPRGEKRKSFSPPSELHPRFFWDKTSWILIGLTVAANQPLNTKKMSSDVCEFFTLNRSFTRRHPAHTQCLCADSFPYNLMSYD